MSCRTCTHRAFSPYAILNDGMQEEAIALAAMALQSVDEGVPQERQTPN
ncbi:hypothetical protein [Paenibacillus pini]|nr:hypothetical protein [Paenibacillus pini]